MKINCPSRAYPAIFVRAKYATPLTGDACPLPMMMMPKTSSGGSGGGALAFYDLCQLCSSNDAISNEQSSGMNRSSGGCAVVAAASVFKRLPMSSPPTTGHERYHTTTTTTEQKSEYPPPLPSSCKPVKYRIGQTQVSYFHSVPFASSSDATILIVSLPLHSPLFVKRTNGEWTYGRLVDRSQDMVTVRLDESGRARKSLEMNKWKKCLRLVKRTGDYIPGDRRQSYAHVRSTAIEHGRSN